MQQLSRPKYRTDLSKLLLFLANSTCTPCQPVIPTLAPTQTLVYSAALAHVSQQLRLSFGTESPTFSHFLLVMREAAQYLPVLFFGKAGQRSSCYHSFDEMDEALLR